MLSKISLILVGLLSHISVFAEGPMIVESSSQMTQSLLMTGALGAVFYLLIWRPQNKQAQEQMSLVTQLKLHDEILTNSGIVGVVTQLDDNFMVLELHKGGQIKMQKQVLKAIYPKHTLTK